MSTLLCFSLCESFSPGQNLEQEEVMHTCNPSTWGRPEDLELRISLSQPHSELQVSLEYTRSSLGYMSSQKQYYPRVTLLSYSGFVAFYFLLA